jgi:hypothetical protein
MDSATTTEFWKYGPITCLVLPLKGLDIGPRLALYKSTKKCTDKSDHKLDHLGLVNAHPQQQQNESEDYQDWGALQEILQEGHTRLLELPLIQELVIATNQPCHSGCISVILYPTLRRHTD